jgi:hypothetical protein
MSNAPPSHSLIGVSPHRGDEFPAAPRWRWTVPLIALTALLALAAIGLEIVFLKTNRTPADAAVREQRDPLPLAVLPAPTIPTQPLLPPASEPNAPPQATVPPARNRSVAEQPAAPPAPTPAPQPKPNLAPTRVRPLPAPPQEMLLEALGGLTAAHLYQTYLNIGLLADGVEGEIYTPADARKLLATVIGLMDTVDKQLARLPEESLKAEERKALLRIRSLSVLLRTQIKEVRTYWETNDKEHAKRFHKAREEAWTGLKELLDLKD